MSARHARSLPGGGAWARALLVGAACYGGVLAVRCSELGRTLTERVSHSLEFRVRRYLGREPRVDSRIKIFLVSDRRLAHPFFAHEWHRIFQNLVDAHPRAIFVEHALEASQTMLGTEGHPTAGRTSRWIAGIVPHPDFLDRELDETPLRLPGFADIGHLATEGEGDVRYIRPRVTVPGNGAIPHMALLLDERPQWNAAGLPEGKDLYLDEYGRLPVNLARPEAYLARAYDLLDLVERRPALSNRLVEPGDVVVLMPRLRAYSPNYEAHADFVPVAVLNSLLTGDTIRPLGGSRIPIFLACVAGVVIAMLLDLSALLPTLLGLVIALWVLGMAAFLSRGWQLPWDFIALGLVASAGAVAVQKGWATERAVGRLRKALAGAVTPEKLDGILNHDEPSHVEAEERVLTLMFIDVVDFTQSAETQSPREAFTQLRDLMASLTEIVNRFGGVVDRTLGDGMLCIFGYEGPEASATHLQAERAVACAIEVQKRQLARALSALDIGKGGALTCPLRIGINTGAVYVGDLGGGDRIDITVIGSGVNTAQRLESACESYRILIGTSTRSLLREMKDVSILKRLVPVKHQREPLEVFEVDPFPVNHEEVNRVLTAHWEALGTERADERWAVPEGTALRVETNHGPGELLNFSLNGFAVRLPSYLGRHLPLQITFGHDDPGLRGRLERAGVQEVLAEVRWARPQDKGFVHGVQIKNLSGAQREALLARLRTWGRPTLKIAGV